MQGISSMRHLKNSGRLMMTDRAKTRQWAITVRYTLISPLALKAHTNKPLGGDQHNEPSTCEEKQVKQSSSVHIIVESYHHHCALAGARGILVEEDGRESNQAEEKVRDGQGDEANGG